MVGLSVNSVAVDVDDIVLSGDFTIQAWVRHAPGQPINNRDGIVASANSDLNFYNGQFRVFARDSGLWDVVIANTPSTPGDWAHYAVVREGGQTRIYIDGELDATAAQSWTDDFVITHIATGAAGLTSNSGLSGDIDELQIWDTARSQAEIRTDLTGSTPPASAGLLRYYQINDGDTQLVDATGSTGPVALPAGAVISDEGAPISPGGTGEIISVAINNAGFEAQVLANGGSERVIDGWEVLSGQGTTGVWNPTAAFFGAEAPEGQNVSFIDNGGAISQILTETFEAGRSYQLSVKVGDESPALENLGWEIRLYAGDQLLGSVGNDQFNPSNGVFVDAVLTLDAIDLTGAANVYGQPLRIELCDAVTPSENNAHFDDVRLSYVEAPVYPGGASGEGEFVDTKVADGFFLPTDLAFLPDGRMLVIEKGGTVKIVDDPTAPGGEVETYLDISAQTLNDAERGLLAVEVDPNFEENGYVYFYYTKREGGNSFTTVSRFVHQDNQGGASSRADASTETVLWQEHDPTSACCHQGGGLSIAYEPIGDNDPSPYKLYIVTSDEFEPANAQDLTHDDGKVHRINLTDGSIPTDNPYYDAAVAASYTPSVDTSSAISRSAANLAIDAEGVITTIHSHGLRNGWRSSYDQESETLFIGEVGGNNNNTSREDIHIAVAGADYGWPGSEGFLPDPNDPGNPIFSYPHLNGPGQGGEILPGASGASLTGGVVYRGDDFPNDYQGAYFYGDWVRNWIRYLEIDYSGERPVVVSDNFFKNATGQVLAFEEGPDGALYYITTFQTGNVFTFQGAVNRLDFESNNRAPTGDGIVLDPGEEIGTSTPYTVTFESDVIDPDGDELSYIWSFGDGEDLDGDGIGDTATSTEANPTYTYENSGQYTVELVVTDSKGAATVFDSRIITVGNAPDPVITLPVDGGTYRAGETITLQGFANDVEDGLIDASENLIWSTTFRLGNVERPGPVDGVADTAAGVSFVTPDSGNLESALDGITVFLTATDSEGLSTTEQVRLTAEKALLSFDAPIENYNFVFDGRGETGDFTFNSTINFNHTIEAQQTYSVDGDEFVFSHWADDPTNTNAVRAITTPEAGAIYRPVYVEVGAPPPPSGLSVTDGLVVRLETNAGVGLNGATDTVSGWSDLSGAGNDLTASGDPQLLANATPTGAAAISFDGAGDKLERLGTETLFELPTGSEDRTVFLVVDYINPNRVWAGAAFGDGARNEAFGLMNTTRGQIGVQGWGGGNDFLSGVSPGDNIGDDEWFVQSVVLSDNAISHFKDGLLIDSDTHVFATDAGSAESSIIIGAEIAGLGFAELDVAAFLVYDRALDDAERAEVEAYLQQTYIDTGFMI